MIVFSTVAKDERVSETVITPGGPQQSGKMQLCPKIIRGR
jgi:hypothetical protein